ncbi:MAG: CHAT domain-containing protein [Actinomycetales bacterium]
MIKPPQTPAAPAPSSAAERLHERAVAAAAGGRFVTASRHSRGALEAAQDGSEIRARILLTYAWAEAEQSRVDVSLGLLDQAEAGARAHPRIAGLTFGQRGVLLLRLGEVQRARRELSRAVTLLGEEPLEQARAYLNRGVAELECHDFAAARQCFEQCRELARGLGLPVLAAKAESNLGLVDGVRGDLPAALGHFQEATEHFGEEEAVLRAGTVVDSGFVLIAAGLLDEAETELLAAAEVLARAGVRFTEAEAWISLSEIALVDERLPAALAYARRASRGFARRGSPAGVLLADAVLAACATPKGNLSAPQLERLRGVATALDRQGLTEEATRLRLRGARRLAGAGRLDRAAQLVDEVRSATKAGSLHTRLLARTVRAELARARGDAAALSREIRTGLADLQRHQSRLGSIDLQTSVVRHGADLARMGLRLAVEGRRPESVLTWLERTRSLATRIPPILPPDDPSMADLLGALRHQRLELRQLELDRDSEPGEIDALRESCRRLERSAAARERALVGSGDVMAEAGAEAVRAALNDSVPGPTSAGTPAAAGTLVCVFDVDDIVHALVVTTSAAELVCLGALSPVEAQIRRVRADLDVLALASTPAMMRVVVRASVTDGLARLGRAVWDPLADLTGDGPLAVIPTGALSTLPWTLVPGLRGRPLTVARSPGEWLRGRERSVHGEEGERRTVFATGPRVERADEEVSAAASAWPHADVLTLAEPSALLAAAAAADLVHVAAHGTHDAENPLFSALELAGGLVFGYDLIRVRPAPRHVVLSACDLGLATSRSGSESLGMTAALLHGGTGSVVAGVARVADGVACDVAVAYHKLLSSGERPSYALAGALAATGADGSGDTLAPLTCFGSGW